MTLYDDLLGGFVHIQNFFRICNLRQSQLFGNLRTYLRRITVNSLAAADDDVIVANLLDGCGKGV